MATVNYASNHPSFTSAGIAGIKWETLTSANLDGQAYNVTRRSDRTVQVVGTFDGCTVTIQGSLDGTTWATLNDLQGTALTFTTSRLEGIAEFVTFIRPLVTSAGASTDIDVYLLESGEIG